MINYEKLIAWPFKDVEHEFTTRDTILYALSLGMGSAPIDGQEIHFVYEAALRAMPTMPLILGMSDVGFMTDPDVGIDMTKLVHSESALVLHAPLPTSGAVVSRMEIAAVVDKGAGKGAIIQFRRKIADKSNLAPIATETGSFFLRGAGGFGGPSVSTLPAIGEISPERAPDIVLDVQTLPQSALLYRLNGDLNPLHADPEIARKAGFGRPILHGACAIGIAGRVLLTELCGHDPLRLKSIGARFSGVIYPGETLRFEIWKKPDNRASFRCKALQRDMLVLTNGVAEVTPLT
jgi:acyl dehydratase